jgi:Fe-S cluster assembly protein SufD
MAVALNSYVAEAERMAAERRSDPRWLTSARRAALERFDRLGFPTTHDEEWRFTSVAPIADTNFAFAPDGAAGLAPNDVAALDWSHGQAVTLVFVNGRYAEGLSRVASLPEGVRIGHFGRALSETPDLFEAYLTRIADNDRHAFTALNTAFITDGAHVHVTDGTVVRTPIHLVFLAAGEQAAPTMAHPRVLLVLGANSEATVVETYASLGRDRYLTNAVTEIVAGEGATIHHYKVQRESPASFHVGAIYLRGAKDATLACNSIAFGGALVRNDVNAVLDGEGGHCTLNGLYLADGTRLVDNHTTIEHARPHCASREVYKGIIADRARAVFNGKIVVRPDAQKTDAKQTNKALLLSEEAQINTKPQLEIFANDVKCTHGAAIGQIDEEAIFYLRARGLGVQEARHMLILAFAGDVVHQMGLESLRADIDAELVRRLPESRP